MFVSRKCMQYCTGTVKIWNSRRGYGRIKVESSPSSLPAASPPIPSEVFVHLTGLAPFQRRKELLEGQYVRFDAVQEEHRGESFRAVNVIVICRPTDDPF
eukprot:PhF_6_TR41162/c0_g2_i1/m.62319/K03704/cspA; cold shock protein (beta-ribbon, CspA family)